MKKVLLISLLLASVAFANAQNNFELNITDIQNWQTIDLCVNDYDSIIIISDDPPCSWCLDPVPVWSVVVFPAGVEYWDEVGNRLALALREAGVYYDIRYFGYDGVQLYNGPEFMVKFHDFHLSNVWSPSYIWKRYGTSTILQAPYGNDLQYQWSTDSTEEEIVVTDPGTYWVSIYNDCGEMTDTIQVRNNVELYRSTVDLETNRNKATWQVTAEQAEYISEVKVYRDGLLVGTVPYEDGFFLDNIGSDNAARNYKIVGVSIEGADCPIASYEKGTIHTTYYEDVNSNLNMTWNIPYVQQGAQGTLTYFQICKYEPVTGELIVVDQVNAGITDYTCGVNQFDGGYAVIAAVFSNGKGLEELSFSNLTMDILGLGENDETAFRIYPNPAKGCVTVEGTGTMTVTNALGQTVITIEIDGKESIELPKGLYFVKMNETTRKVVVE